MQVVLQSTFELGFSTWAYTSPVYVELQLQWVGKGFQSGDPLLHTQAICLEVKCGNSGLGTPCWWEASPTPIEGTGWMRKALGKLQYSMMEHGVHYLKTCL